MILMGLTVRTSIGLVGETGKRIGVVEAEKEKEVVAIERRTDNWNMIGSGKRETRKMMEQEEVAGEVGDKSLVKTGQTTRGEMMYLDWMGRKTYWRSGCLIEIFEADGDREGVEGVEERGRLGYCRTGQRNTNFLRPSRLRWRLRSRWTRMCRRATIH
jgi:hypothetical protein